MDPALKREVALLANVRAIDDAIERGDSEIQQYYNNATILVTGGSGFMGKQLLEKLFRSCDIKKVFLLMRPKRKKSFKERLDIILEDAVFDRVKNLRPGFEKKICPIQGDVAEPRLGISDGDRQVITNETEIIFHSAATVNFDEPLKVAINTNVRGTMEIIELAKQCQKLKSIVHVSTAYSHATYSRASDEVAERFYEAPLSPQLAVEMANTIDEKRLQDITPQLIQNWPNTYTFTKAIGEEAVRQVETDLPICIVRPAIVIASYQEPSSGWVDSSNVSGPCGIVVAIGLGLLHVMLMKPNIKLDFVPVDLVNNAIVVAGWAAASKNQEQGAKIYTVTTMRNHIRFSTTIDLMCKSKFKTPKSLYYIFLHQTRSKFVNTFLSWLWHFIPAYIIDFLLRVIRKKPMAVKLYTKAEKLKSVLTYFAMHEWLSRDKNLQELFASLNASDKLIYNCDTACINWQEMLTSWIFGVRKYIFKDGLQGTEYAMKKQFWLKILHYVVVVPLYFFSLYKIVMLSFAFLYFIISTFLNCTSRVFN